MKKIISVILAVCMTAALMIPAFASAPTDSCPEYGNVDGAAGVTVSDARLILRKAVNLEAFTDEQTTRGDLDANGTITVADARMALRIAVQLDKAPAHPVTVSADTATENEYNVLSTTKYLITGTMTDSSGKSTPMTLARNGNKMYMSTTMDLLGDGSYMITIGILVLDGELYMVTEDHKYSLHITDKVAEAFDMSQDNINELTDISNFKIDTPDLSTASSVDKATVTCPVCGESFTTGTVYTFKYSDGTMGKVYMNGNKLLKIESLSKAGKVTSTTSFTTISATPADSYFALPSSSLHRYPTTLQTPTIAIATFMAKVLNVDVADIIKLLNLIG